LLAGIRSRLTYANVVASLALFIALGGVAWAAATIKSGDVVDNSLKSVDLKDGKGVQGADVVPDSLTGGAIDESSLNEVPSAQDAETLDDKDSGEFQAVGSDGWTTLPPAPAGQFCGWSNYGGEFADAAYFRDQEGIVHLRGLVRAVDGSNVACGNGSSSDWRINDINPLPLGYRPEDRVMSTVSSNDKPGRVDVTANFGFVVMENNYPTFADAKQWLQLDGISFRCGPSGQNGCP
jgi:hypothetical protein